MDSSHGSIRRCPDTSDEKMDQPDNSHSPRISKARVDDWLDNALSDTFPASDPVASPPFGPAFVEDWR
jgi:hypothetical protein